LSASQVTGHGARLDRDPLDDELGDDGRQRVGDPSGSRLDQVEDRRIGDEAALDHLGEAAAQLGGRQRREHVQVAQHADGFVERADEVLALGGVDAGLAPDGGVDHAEHGRRHVDESHATQPAGGDEAGQIGRGTTTEADDDVGPGESRLAQDAPAERQDVGGLGLLAVGHLDEVHLEVVVHQRLSQGLRLGGHGRRVDDRDPHDAEADADQAAELLVHAVADHDVVGTLGGHVQAGGAHG
jgi:hypothetical protein